MTFWSRNMLRNEKHDTYFCGEGDLLSSLILVTFLFFSDVETSIIQIRLIFRKLTMWHFGR